MTNPDMPNMNIPGMSSMTDTLEFVKKLWGGMGVPGAQGAPAGMPGMSMPGANIAGMNIPGMVMPTLSVEEINKKITDLKTVETWLAMNMNMLRGTIQALEVQAATLNALNAMGQTVSATMKAAGMSDPAATAFRSAATGASSAQEKRSGAADKGQGASQPNAKDEQDAAALAAPLVNAAAWWNLLQDQFQQAVSTAMAPEAADAAKSTAPGAKAKPKTGGSSASKSKSPKA